MDPKLESRRPKCGGTCYSAHRDVGEPTPEPKGSGCLEPGICSRAGELFCPSELILVVSLLWYGLQDVIPF